MTIESSSCLKPNIGIWFFISHLRNTCKNNALPLNLYLAKYSIRVSPNATNNLLFF